MIKIREENEAVHKLVIDFKKTHDSMREVLYNTLTEFGIQMKLVSLIKCI